MQKPKCASQAAWLMCTTVLFTLHHTCNVEAAHWTKRAVDGYFVADPSADSSLYEKIDDMTFIKIPEGNMSANVSSKQKRNVVRGTYAKWVDGVIPYEISSVFSPSERAVILEAMNHWEVNTCIRFHPKTFRDYYSIFILSGQNGDCSSYVGRLSRIWQPQGISIGRPNCVYFPTIVHELGHAIGFYHEHSRPDRNEHVEILYENIRHPSLHGNFNRLHPSQTNLLGYGYDYASIMHYRGTAFSVSRNRQTIVAKDSSIPIGGAKELSPLDIERTNVHYNCGPKSSHPPISTILPTGSSLTIPSGFSCGEVIEGIRGTFRSPGFPNHRHNQDCAWVVKVPEGYYIDLEFPYFRLEESASCLKDYVQIYHGISTSDDDLLYFSSSGRICERYYNTYYVYNDVITLRYHTDGSNSGRTGIRGLEVTFEASDINECREGHRCHSCRNLAGSFQCTCRRGYYLSKEAKTCYDMNECAYGNGGCQHKCINSGGSYRCTCNTGFYLQADGLSCGRTRPSTTTKPPPTPPTPVPVTCGGHFTLSSGSFQTPNWPQTYPVNFDCEWLITLPDSNKAVEISFSYQPFGIAGNLPNCEKDHLKVYDGHSDHNTTFGPFCHFAVPGPIRTTTNLAKIVFHAGPAHSPSRAGFKATYTSIERPTTQPPPTTQPLTTLRPTTQLPTTLPPKIPLCEENFTLSNGSFQTPNWPETYPFDFDCEWFITLPDVSNVIEISFDRIFGIAGRLPDCTKDYLKVYDGHSHGDAFFGPFCQFAVPDTIRTSTNLAKVVFHAGPLHFHSRKGFKAIYVSVKGPTTPPSTLGTTQPQGTLLFTTEQPTEKLPSNSLTSTTAVTEQPTTLPAMVTTASTSISSRQTTNQPASTTGKQPLHQTTNQPASTTEEQPLNQTTNQPTSTTGKQPLYQTTNQPASTTEEQPLNQTTNQPTSTTEEQPLNQTTKPTFTTETPTEYSPTTQLPTTPPFQCGDTGILTTQSGTLESPNWPETYPVNLDCEWFITVPDVSKVVEISFNQRFGIAGSLPDCKKDYLMVYSGHSKNNQPSFGPFCFYTVPDPIKTSSNKAKIVFHAGPAHSSSRKGFKATYKSVDNPCGGSGLLSAASGALNTPNWPQTYPVNLYCEWHITLPDSSKAVEISFSYQPFGIAGNLPNCEKDYIKVYDGHSDHNTTFGPFCHYAVPGPIRTTTNLAKIVFYAGPAHSPSRAGFKATYTSVDVNI